jgi:hypothetical protein
VQEVTQAYRAQDVTTGQKLPLYQGPPREGTTQARISVPIGLALPARSYSEDVARLVGDPTTIVEFRAFRVTEDVPRYRKETVDLPAPPARPCDSCAAKPCLTACPVAALTGAGYDVPRCHAHLDQPEGVPCMSGGCLVRRACPASQPYARMPVQSAYHMRQFHR